MLNYIINRRAELNKAKVLLSKRMEKAAESGSGAKTA